MSYTLLGEAWNSRKAKVGWQGCTEELKLLISGGEDDSQARLVVAANAPGTIANSGDPTTVFQDYDLEYLGNGLWLATCNYVQRVPKQPGDSTYNFEIGGGQQKITQSLATVNSYVASGSATNFNGAIGVGSDGQVEGCEIYVPTYSFSETHYIPVASVTSGYKANLYAVANAPVNNASFRGFNAGEVLFLGATGTQRGEDDWEITFKFAASPNVTGLTIGSITGIAKNGWDYLWVRYQQDHDGGTYVQIAKPIQVNVERVYYSGDFTLLGI